MHKGRTNGFKGLKKRRIQIWEKSIVERGLGGLAEAQPAGAKKGKREGFSMKGLWLNRMSPRAAQRLGMNQLKGGETGRRPTGLCKPQSFSAEPPFLPHESCHPSLEMTYEMSVMNMDLL